ncbi:MAG: GtrA family protein [Ruminococcaceae bacterium]|nr:GtrA family protein [Oscillospiraceae bacterium]
MYEKLKALYEKYRATVIYLVFGVLTTVVNYAVYLPLYNFVGLPASVCNGIAWVAAVAFAYVTNKLFVFESKSWGDGVFGELLRFVGSRVASGAVETVSLLLTVDILGWNGNIMKLLLAVFVIVFNYVLSKFFVFKK